MKCRALNFGPERAELHVCRTTDHNLSLLLLLAATHAPDQAFSILCAPRPVTCCLQACSLLIMDGRVVHLRVYRAVNDAQRPRDDQSHSPCAPQQPRKLSTARLLDKERGFQGPTSQMARHRRQSQPNHPSSAAFPYSLRLIYPTLFPLLPLFRTRPHVWSPIFPCL